MDHLVCLVDSDWPWEHPLLSDVSRREPKTALSSLVDNWLRRNVLSFDRAQHGRFTIVVVVWRIHRAHCLSQYSERHFLRRLWQIGV